MYILGIAGWNDRGHDASATLLKDGKIVAAVEEEKLIRKKYSYDTLPHNSIKYCLDVAGIGVNEIDHVAVYWDWPYHYKIRGMTDRLDESTLPEQIFPRTMFDYGKSPRISFIEHHLSHASSAFRVSGYDKSAIVVADGQGEDVSTSLWYGDGNQIKLVRKIGIPDSLGYFYEASTGFVGLEPNEPGKTMGLAAYGRRRMSLSDAFTTNGKSYRSNINRSGIVLGKDGVSDEETQIREQWVKLFSSRFGRANAPSFIYDQDAKKFARETIMTPVYMDAAASAQAIVEDMMLYLAKIAVEETGSKNLSLSGGVGLNCVANGKILRSGIVDDIFIQPAANDAGCSMGAALELYSRLGYNARTIIPNVYLGPAFSEEAIERELLSLKIPFKYQDDPEGMAAQLITNGKIVGWFQGGMEWGPRALGNRSILADPRNPDMKNRLNEAVKYREWYRPFGPSMLDEAAANYLEQPHSSPYMILGFDVRKDRAGDIPAVVHVDGTTRPQTVDKKSNPRYRKLIENVGEITGVPVVVNTSLNVKGEALVCSPRDALRTMYGSGMDYLFIGDFMIEK
ncbi:MAG: hypothetical protein HY364_00695 [Candidatus Aenigmarchaeota archaeon]|nr:hypothetical protein [Candidatus Aenigmarchaeota archaeon]